MTLWLHRNLVSALAKRANWLSIEDLTCAHLCCILTKHLKIQSITETKDNTESQEVYADFLKSKHYGCTQFAVDWKLSALLAELYKFWSCRSPSRWDKEEKILTVAVWQKDGSLYCCPIGFNSSLCRNVWLENIQDEVGEVQVAKWGYWIIMHGCSPGAFQLSRCPLAVSLTTMHHSLLSHYLK